MSMDDIRWMFVDDGTRYENKEKGKVTLALQKPLSSSGAAIDGKSWFNRCIRIPITSVIPPEQRGREGRKLKVTGVGVRLSCAASDGIQMKMVMLLRESEESLVGDFNNLSLGTALEKADGRQETPLAPLGTVGVVSKYGPLRMTEQGRFSPPHGEDGKASQRMVNWFSNEYWKVNKEYGYMHGGQDGLAHERSAEVLWYVYSRSLGLKGVDMAEAEAVPEAVLRNAIVDIYYEQQRRMVGVVV